ncbi:Zinc finger, CCHC-type, partial [Parasponia andersonii]
MANSNNFSFQYEGLSPSKPLFFNGNNFNYWKSRMDTYLRSIDFDLWYIVTRGLLKMTKIVNGVEVEKDIEEYDEKDKMSFTKNGKARNILMCGLDRNVYNNIEKAKDTHELWNMLEVSYQGTNSMKETRINIFTRNYELFKMDKDESISQMLTRFTSIINSLSALGKTFSNGELVSKILRSLPRAYRSKMVAIQEAKNLSKLTLEELMDSLMSHEILMKETNEDEGEEKKKKGITLKATLQESNEEEEEFTDSELEDIALLTKRYKKYLNFKKKNFNKNIKDNDFREKKMKDDPITCFECKKQGHMKNECLLRRKMKKKAMKATWDDSEEEESNGEEQEEIANMCFMAIENEVSSLEPKNKFHDVSDTSSEFSDCDCDLSYKNLLSDFNNLHKNYEKLIFNFKNNALKKEILNLPKIVEKFTKEKKVKLPCSSCDILSK